MRQKVWQLAVRLNRLPGDQITKVRDAVMQKTGISKSSYYRLLREEQAQDYVLAAFAEVLRCKVEDVTNPAYKFKDPELAAELGLSK